MRPKENETLPEGLPDQPEERSRLGICRAVLTILLPAAVILGFSVAGLLLPDQEVSASERRRLAQAWLIRTLIIAVIVTALAIWLALMFAAAMSNPYYYYAF